MKSAVFVVAALAACAKPKPVQLAPLPPDGQAVEPAQAKADTPPPEPATPARPVPVGPLDVKIAPATASVKLVSPGKGKRMPLRLTAKQGATQQVEIALDFALSQSARVGDQTETITDIVPTVVLSGPAEVKAIDKDGKATYELKVTKTDARDVAGSKVPIDKFKQILEATAGLVVGGDVAANGATGEITMHVEQQGEATGQILELARLTMPVWPAFPTEPVGVGAKWQATMPIKLAGRLDVTQVTSYELVARENGVWTIKGTSKISGADQTMQGGNISKITGAGTTEITLADGALYPTHKTVLDASFTAAEADAKTETPATIDFNVKIGGAVKVQ